MNDMIFTNNLKTLKNISINDNENFYMTESELIAIDFDSVKDTYFSHLENKSKDTPMSNDAIILNSDNELFFIEFKDADLGKKEVAKISRKNYDSLLILLDLLNKTISYSRKNVNYILVYKKDKIKKFSDIPDASAFDLFSENMSSLAKRSHDIFDLRKRFEHIYFKKVETLTKEQFDKYITENDFVDINQSNINKVLNNN